MGDEPLQILLVEDNDADIALVRKLLMEGFSTSPVVLVRRSLSGAIIALRENLFDAVILDLGLPDSWGIRSLERLRETADDVPIVVLTALDDYEVGREAIAAGADDYLLKDERSSAFLARSIRYSIERMSIRRRMRKSEERFRALVENISDAVLMLADGEIRYVTPSIRNLLGYVPSDWSPDEFVNVFHPEERDTVARALRSVGRAPGAKVSLECRTHHVGGGWRRVELTLRNLRSDPLIGGLVLTVKDVTERSEAEAARRAAEERYRTVVESAPIGFYVVQDGEITYANPHLAEILGRPAEELVGRDLLEFVDERDRPRVGETLEGHAREDGEGIQHAVRGERGDGDRFEVEIQGIRVEIDGRPAVIGSVQDRTEQKRLTEGLVRAQRMEAVGRLSRVVAGDFNDILTGIIGHCDLALASLDDAAEERPDLEGVRRQAAKGVGQIRKLLAYSRQQVVRPRLLHPNRAIRNVSGMIDRLIGEGISVRSELSDFAEVVRIDPGQLELVVVNLVANARDAIGDDGVISIATESVDLTEEEVAHFPFEMPPGRYVELSVTDDGVGMSPETLERIFEPFFTTKPVGEGTGLGLAQVYGFARQSGGTVSIQSELGKGTRVSLLLPRMEQAVCAIPEDQDASVRAGRPARVLVVDDDAEVREAMVAMLDELGYQVDEAPSADDALARLADRRQPAIDILLSDVVMPGRLDGVGLAEEVQRLYPTIPIILASGYTTRIATEPAVRVLAKPFSHQALAETLSEILDSNTPAPPAAP